MNTGNSTNAIFIYTFVTTAVVMIVLFAMGIVPLWIAAAILVADAAFAWFITAQIRARS